MRAYMHLSMSVGKDQGFSILQSRISEGLVKEPDSCEKRLFISFLFFFFCSGRVVFEFKYQKITLDVKYVDCLILFLYFQKTV